MHTPAAAAHFDVLIRNGMIVDGTGKQRYRADVAIDADRIVAVGDLGGATAARIVDASDRIVAPGFIDMHAHIADGDNGEQGLLSSDVRRRAAQNFVAQGVTTAVINPDGSQAEPLEELMRKLTAKGFGVNVVPMNGHSGLRERVMKGDVHRRASRAEIKRMQAILRHDLQQKHSFGLSLGLEYERARDSSLEEQLALARVLREFDAIFIPHLRSQGSAPMWYRPGQSKGISPPTLDGSIAETLQVAETTGVKVVFTHFKAWGPGYRGEASRLIARLQAARDRGARVYMDVYPYSSSSSDGHFVALPPWAFGVPGKDLEDVEGSLDYRKALDSLLAAASPRQMQDLVADVRHQIGLKGGAGNIQVLDYTDPTYIGQTYAQLMKMRGLGELGLAIALQHEGDPLYPGGARMRSLSMAEEDIEAFYKLDWCAMSTDGWIVLPEEAIGADKYADTHRRVFGSYPRRLAHYSVERKVDTLEHAVRAATSLPAQILGLDDRGRLAAGVKADLVVLNMTALRDRTTYLEPSVYPSGVDYVLINGQFAVDDGERTLALAGRVLTRVKGHKDAT